MMHRISVAYFVGGILVPLALTGCSLAPGLSPVETRYFQIPEQDLSAGDLPRCDRAIVVREMEANPFVGSRRILFGDRAYERGYYQYASWIEPPPRRIATLLEHGLESSGRFGAISTVGSGTRSDLALNTELTEFFHDVTTSPGKVRIEVRAELVELKRRTIVGVRNFTEEVEVSTFTSEGAVQAFAAATKELLAKITQWISSECRALDPADGRSSRLTEEVPSSGDPAEGFPPNQ